MVLTFFIAAVVFPCCNLLSVFFTQEVIDAISNGKSFSELASTILFYSLLLLLLGIINNIFDSYYFEKKEAEIRLLINRDICLDSSQIDYKCFDDPSFYDKYTWTLNEFPNQAAGARRILINACISVFTIILMVSFISLLSPWIILLVVMQIVLSIIIETKQNKININKKEKINSINRRMNYINTIFYGKEYAADIRCTQLSKYLFKDYTKNQTNLKSTIESFANKLFGYNLLLNINGKAYTIVLMMVLCYQFIISKSISGIGKFSSLLNATGQLSSSLYSTVGVFKAINASVLYVDKFQEFQSLSHTMREKPNTASLISTGYPFSLDIDHLSFKYPNSNFGLNNISIHIKPGEKIAIVGENGAGKTTLIKLLLKLYCCDSGDIHINGTSINDVSTVELRQNLGVAFQSPHIYALSLYDNIYLYSFGTSEYDIEEILNKLNLKSILEKAGGDVYSPVTKQFDKNGIELSGGEIQKIALSRILSKKFGLIILDEASSALDPNAEYEMNRDIFNTANTATTILIAHRLSTIRDADRIYVMSDGKIIENGTHEELINLQGKYCEMFTKQAEKYRE